MPLFSNLQALNTIRYCFLFSRYVLILHKRVYVFLFNGDGFSAVETNVKKMLIFLAAGDSSAPERSGGSCECCCRPNN